MMLQSQERGIRQDKKSCLLIILQLSFYGIVISLIMFTIYIAIH